MKGHFDSASVKTAIEFNDALTSTPIGTQFLLYIEKRLINPQAVWNKMDDEDLLQEFLLKCQWVQHYSKTKLDADVTMEVAATVVNTDACISFNKEVCDKIFDGFIHFVAANETRPGVLDSIIKTWVAQGRELTELDSKNLTPLQVSVYTKNVMSVAALAHNEVDITAIDADGYSPLHVIVNKIEDGSADISLLQKWLDADLPTDMVCGEAARGLVGKTAVECAEAKGSVEVTELLGGDVELAVVNLDKLFVINRDLIQKGYAIKCESTSALKSSIADDANKLLLHYLIENHDQISYQVFVKFLADEELNIKTNVVFGGKTALEKCVELGYNDWALALARQGVGTDALDNGVNILNHCITYDNNDLLKLLENDTDFDVADLAMPTKLYQVNPETSIVLTPLLQAVLKGDIEMVVKLAKGGVGTTSLDNTNHILNYVNNFAGDKKIAMAKALMKAGIDVSDEKAEQALIGCLHPEVNSKLATIYIEGGVASEGALKLFATHGLLPQIKCLIIDGGVEVTAEIDELVAEKSLTTQVEGFKLERTEIDAETQRTKPFTFKEKMKFVLTKIVEGASEGEMIESYPGSDGLGEKFIGVYSSYKSTQAERPEVFEGLCKLYKVALPVIAEEPKEVSVDDLVAGTVDDVDDFAASNLMGAQTTDGI